MKEYLETLFGVCLLCAIVKTVTPSKALRSYVNVICALCTVCVIIMPLVKHITEAGGVGAIFEYDPEVSDRDFDKIYSEYLLEGNEKASEEILKNEIARVFSLDADSFDVGLCISEKNGRVYVESAMINLRFGALDTDPVSLTEYVEKRTGAVCEIIYF